MQLQDSSTDNLSIPILGLVSAKILRHDNDEKKSQINLVNEIFCRSLVFFIQNWGYYLKVYEEKSFWDLDGCDRRDIDKELYRCFCNLKYTASLAKFDIKRLMTERLEELELDCDET